MRFGDGARDGQAEAGAGAVPTGATRPRPAGESFEDSFRILPPGCYS
jgi:hypothetical protein